jgi:carbonic anhydrase
LVKTIIDDLRNGHARYRKERLPDYQPLFKKLADRGQNPKALVIACSDSRVDPALMFDQEPGDLFIVRNVANVVPPYEPKPGYHGTSAALEFAVKGLEVSDIIVMGHAQCGGINALMSMADGEAPIGEFIGPWMSIAEPAVQLAQQDTDTSTNRSVRTEQAVVRLSLQNLKTFPWVTERIANGNLALHGFYFDISNGFVQWLNPEEDKFEDFA